MNDQYTAVLSKLNNLQQFLIRCGNCIQFLAGEMPPHFTREQVTDALADLSGTVHVMRHSVEKELNELPSLPRADQRVFLDGSIEAVSFCHAILLIASRVDASTSDPSGETTVHDWIAGTVPHLRDFVLPALSHSNLTKLGEEIPFEMRRAAGTQVRIQQQEPLPTPTTTQKRRRRQSGEIAIKPLTPKQLEAITLHGELKGNMNEVAKRMGVSRQTANEHYERGTKKLGAVASKKKVKTERLRTDGRGQEILADTDD